MSALSIQPTYPIFTDIDGQPLEAGYVWLGQANLDPQVNPINVYWDAALSIPATQPVRTLGGYPSRNGTPARLYVNSDYSIRVQNRNGSTVYSAQAATERYNEAVISSINAQNVVYDPPFNNAVATNVEARLAQVVSVKDFGAVGDGITDDTSAIADAVASLSVTGGTIYFPAGEYVTDTIVLPLYSAINSINFEGVGRESSVLKPLSSNQKLIRCTGITTNIGGQRFVMRNMGMKPHASGSTTCAVDMQNMSNCLFENISFVQNGAATFDIGWDLYAVDLPSPINCYYNVFENVYVMGTSGTPGPNLAVKQVIKIHGNAGNHTINKLRCVGRIADTARPMISIGSYCRHNNVNDCHFEGMQTVYPNTVIQDGGYGNYYFQCYFEDSGQPFYMAGEIETGTRRWTIVEKCAFALNTIDTNTDAFVAGSTWRDNYAFGSLPVILATLYRLQKINFTERIYFNYTGTGDIYAGSYWSNSENFVDYINSDGAGTYVKSAGYAEVRKQANASGGFVAISCAPVGVPGNPITTKTSSYFRDIDNVSGISGLNAAQFVYKDNTTGRSINANGTINASGADYAEYMVKAGDFTIQKGDVCGIDTNGKLTNVFADAVSFVVKSTNPSYVGGDEYFPNAVGDRPMLPFDREATEEEKAKHLEDTAKFDAALEEARQKVDRIAFAGQVPVNVLGAVPGQYIIPVNDDGNIKGSAVSNPTFEQYQIAVGKIIAIEDDGRARIIVKVA
jgi:hypothetical protein